jgi:hypothetical protein
MNETGPRRFNPTQFLVLDGALRGEFIWMRRSEPSLDRPVHRWRSSWNGPSGIAGTISPSAPSWLPGDRGFRTDGPVAIRTDGCYTKLERRSRASNERNRPIPACTRSDGDQHLLLPCTGRRPSPRRSGAAAAGEGGERCFGGKRFPQARICRACQVWTDAKRPIDAGRSLAVENEKQNTHLYCIRCEKPRIHRRGCSARFQRTFEVAFGRKNLITRPLRRSLPWEALSDGM